MADLPIPQDFNRFIPPMVDDFLEEKTEDDWADEKQEEMVENDDGSVTIFEAIEEEVEKAFDVNLAEDLTTSKLGNIATEYLEFIDRDKKSREKRDEQYEEGIRRTGLGEDAPGGATFTGASRVVHPVLAEGCVDFAARAIKELCPPNGPVKTKILGKTDGQKLKKANRKRNFLNWQLTKQCPEFFTEMEQMLSQLPLGGSQYMKVLPHGQQKRPEFEFVPIDKLLVPFAASNFYTAQRVTHIQELTEQTFNKRIDSGYYRDVEAGIAIDTDETKSEKASNKVEGKDASTYNEDGLRTVYEVSCFAEFDFDKVTGGKLAPYVLVIDESLSTVLAIYRNWDQKDTGFNKLDWMVEFKFIPWRGAMAIGLPHLIGGLAAALTGALRALLDSAHVNNAPTALKLKGARLTGQTKQVEITQIQEIDGPVGMNDIRGLIMPMPFNPPSQVLFQLLDWLTNSAKGVVATAEEKIADASNQMPVGTALALIEQGSINYSAIHMRLHNSMAKLLEIVCRIDKDVLDDDTVIDALGDDIIYREDFEDSTDIIPVSDPNIFSEAQRYAQIQAVMQLMQVGEQQGVKYNVNEVHRRALTLMKVDDLDDILPAQHKPTEMNALAENVTAMLGNEILVFPHQDHMSHIESHLRFATDPNYGANTLVAAKAIPQLLEHISQHIAFLYADSCNEVATNAVGDVEAVDKGQLDALLAAVSAKVSAGSQALFQPIQAMLQQAQQLLQGAMPQPPLDPAVQVQREIGMAEIERQKAKDAGELDFKHKAHTEELSFKETVEQSAAQEALQKQMDTNAKEVEKLKQAAEALQLKAQDMLSKAATEQQKLELAREKQEIDYQLKVAELQRKEIEFTKKLMLEQLKEVDVEDPRILELTAEIERLKSTETNSQDNGIMQAVLEQLARPKTINVMRDAKGRAISLTQE